jgi:hypothetical protein
MAVPCAKRDQPTLVVLLDCREEARIKVRPCVAAVVAAIAVAMPIVARAVTFHVNNQSDAWVLLSASFTAIKEPLASDCVAPDQSHSLPASRIKIVYVIALSHANCVAPREWEQEFTTDGRGSIISAAHSGASRAPNAGSEFFAF